MKLARLERIIQLVTILQSGRCYNYDELAEQLQVTRRTIFRDLSTLQKAGISCVYDDEKGGYRIDDQFYLPPLNLTVSETLALLLVAQNDRNSETLPLQRKANEAAMKIQSALPSALREQCGRTLKHISVRPGARACHDRLEEVFNQLQRAVRQGRQVKITYDSLHDKDIITLKLNPMHLHFSHRAWYVIGHSSKHQSDKSRALHRFGPDIERRCNWRRYGFCYI